jgi:hypothetical protein
MTLSFAARRPRGSSEQHKALDLVKNAVFLQAERDAEDIDVLYEEYWRPTFEADHYWRQEERQGVVSRVWWKREVAHSSGW